MKKNFILLLIFFTVFAIQNSEAQMFWNQAASFNVSSASYVSVPNSTSLNITGSFSIEAWVNPTSVTGVSKGILSKGGALGTSLKYALRISSGRIQVITNGAVRLLSNPIR